MQKDELLKLRQKVVESAQHLALNGSGAVDDRLRILVGVIEDGNANAEIANKAYELAQGLEDDDAKLSAFMDIIYGVDQSLARSDAATDLADAKPVVNKVEESSDVPVDQGHMPVQPTQQG